MVWSSISFSIVATNNYVSTTLTAVQVEITEGAPLMQAVLVDTDDFPTATWSSFTPIGIPVNLGQTEGWHDVWVGLRGLLESSQVWERKRLKLDTTAPILAVTNTAPGSVSEPMIQLQGFSTEPAVDLSCTISNAAGIFPEQMIFVLKQLYDTNTWEMTTNIFQAFDLELANGLNTITIAASDLAGNRTTTNLDFILQSDAVAPVLTSFWPHNGAAVCGDSLTWRGRVDDFTSSLVASITGPTGPATEAAVIVERDGFFWAEDLPLSAGANILELTATDAWGNVTVTNIQVVKSDIGLTIDPVTSDLNEPRVTVTGGIATAGYTVWVNGVKAEDNGDSTWTADGVPVTSGNTAVIQARAIPNSDNGGNGTGGGGGTSANYESPGNPTSLQAQDIEVQTDKPQGIHPVFDVITHQSFYLLTYTDTAEVWREDENRSGYNHGWGDEGGGEGKVWTVRTIRSGTYDYQCEGATEYEWPPSLTANGTQTTTCSGEGDCIEHYEPSQGETGPVPICKQSCKVSPPPRGRTWYGEHDGIEYTETEIEEFSKSATTILDLRTGGKAIAKRQNLWVISGSAAEITDHWEPWPCHSANVPSRPIPPQEVEILGSKLRDDWRLYKVLPDGVTMDATPYVRGKSYYRFDANGQKFTSHLDVFVRQPFPRFPNDLDEFWPDPPPLGYPVYDIRPGGKEAGHAWWRLRTQAPAEVVSEFAGSQVDLSHSLNIECGYGPSGDMVVRSWLPPEKQADGKLYHDNGTPDVLRVYIIGFQGPGLVGGLQHSEQLRNNPGIWNSSSHNCVHETSLIGEKAGVTLPVSDGTPESFGFQLPSH
jgi:hypothetical protein